jgi:NarL family two-component system sensor histidine kinase LiaS
MVAFFRGLRGKLILTYTLVTVLALMALEAIILLAAVGLLGLTRGDQQGYQGDVLYVLAPRARVYLHGGDPNAPVQGPMSDKPNIAGLQGWVEALYDSGYASLAPQGLFDSPAAAIVQSEPVLVLSPEGTVLAQAPVNENSLVGRQYTPPADGGVQEIIERALAGEMDPLRLSARTAQGKVRMAVPVLQEVGEMPVIGVILLTIEPAPTLPNNVWPILFVWLAGTGVLMLVAVAPLGALFGLVMSRGLTRRLTRLAQAADAWSEGDFKPLPADRSQDEIGMLGRRMRNMAERIQALLHTQQELAALEERNRLARELHDTVKQQTFATLMQVRAARNLILRDPSTAQVHLNDAEGLLKTSQQELGRLIAELRPAALEGQGLPGALGVYLKTWSEHSRIPAVLQVTGERHIPLALEQGLYRVAQEALSNVARHARASEVRVRLAFDDQNAVLDIWDNGVGFSQVEPNYQPGFGLQSMRERMAALGGSLEVAGDAGEGTRVMASAPVELAGAGRTGGRR